MYSLSKTATAPDNSAALCWRATVSPAGSAGSVEEALALIESDPRVDVLFSDIHFPGGLTGVDLALKTAHAPYNLPVLLTSGLAVEYVEEILPNGVAFLEKPYTPEQLLSAIRSVMAKHRVLVTPVA